MSNCSPKPEHEFSFGLRTVGNRGADPLRSASCPQKSPADFINLLVVAQSE